MWTREYKLKYLKEYRKNHPEKYKRTPEKYKEYNQKGYRKNLSGWEGFLPKETTCQVCGKSIFFNSQNHNTSIHFDHRRGNEPIKGSPVLFLRNHKRTPEREAIWKSCDFGMLCQECNRMLPTEGRKEFLLQALRYADL